MRFRFAQFQIKEFLVVWRLHPPCARAIHYAVRSDGSRRMIWIGPPDSSRFSKVQNRIYGLIQRSVPRGDLVIDSRRFRRYVTGKTGGDGIHYNSESGEAWAKPVNATLDQILAADIAARRKVVTNR